MIYQIKKPKNIRPFWLYSLFQIPLILLVICLIMALIFWFFQLGKPPVAMAIAIDFSTSTYRLEMNEPNTIMNQEIEGLNAYLENNQPGFFQPRPQIQIFAFAENITPLTSSFQTDKQQIKSELNQAINTNILDKIGGKANLNQAIIGGIQALSYLDNVCRQLVIVTNQEMPIEQTIIHQAKENRVNVNAVIMDGYSPILNSLANETGGQYFQVEDIKTNNSSMFSSQIWEDISNNWGFILFWLGLAWICLMWLIVMPLDRCIFQGWFKMRMDLSGKLALGNAFFWSALTPIIIGKLSNLWGLYLPFISQC